MCDTSSHHKQLVCIFQSFLYTQNRTRSNCIDRLCCNFSSQIRVGCLPRITHILFTWLVCVLLAHRKQFIHVNYMLHITHILLSWTVSVVFPNQKLFVRVNHMSYIAHTLIWLPVSVVLPHHKQFEQVHHMPFIAHATKTWTVFDAYIIANVLHLFWWFFLHHRLRLLHRTQFRQRVFDHSVTLAASCSSEESNFS